MKTKRFWIELVGLSTGIACALAFLIATLGAAAAGASGISEVQPSDSEPAQQPTAPAPPTHESSQPQAAKATAQAKEVNDRDAQEQTYAGMVTCSRCGAKHPAKMDRSATDCTRSCVRSGAGFSLVDGDKTYQLEGDLVMLKEFAGRRARVVGTANGNTIRVSSVASEI